MKLDTKTQRTTKIVMTNKEFTDAIRQYLKSKNVVDADQYLRFDPIHRRDDRGIECEVTLINYNKDNNIC